MSVFAIEATQAHIEDLRREGSRRRRAAAARRAGVDRLARPEKPERTFWQVRRVLGARP